MYMETRTQKTALDQFWKENYFPQTISGNRKLGRTSTMWSWRAEPVPVPPALLYFPACSDAAGSADKPSEDSPLCPVPAGFVLG